MLRAENITFCRSVESSDIIGCPAVLQWLAHDSRFSGTPLHIELATRVKMRIGL
jgi:hypothetical protein